ncbi:chorismate mutase [Firmicutes bacterium M10-2]|nr:chorismate mutase [Firmicutes bacterium M10-2]
MNQLEKARIEIDSIDRQIAKLYEQRMDTLKDVAEYKMKTGKPIVDHSREEAIIERNAKFIQNESYRDSYVRLLKFVIKESCDHQRALAAKEIIAYAGVEGAFAHMAAEHVFPGNKKLAKASFDEVFEAVVNKEAQYGIIPFENTNSGLVGEVLDGLLKYPVKIEQVRDETIEQCLLGVQGATLKDIELVYSKDQALMQAKRFIAELGARPVAYANTALAARFVAEQNDIHIGAIAAKENAMLYGLHVLASNIEENPQNTTRFLVVSLKGSTKGIRSSLIVTFKNDVGALAKVIQIISDHGLDMCSIQSRPRKGHPFEYFFFIEIIGNIKDDVLNDLKEVCEQIKYLGTYPLG